MSMDLVEPNAASIWAKYDRHFSPSSSTLGSSSDVYLIFDDCDGDTTFGACFLCPFCCVEIEVRAFCGHLEEEHCFDMKNAVCPVCAANFGRDLIGHITVQHSQLLKRRRFHKLASPTTGLTAQNKDHEKLLFFLGVASDNIRTNVADVSLEKPVSPNLPSVKDTEKASINSTSRTSDVLTSERDGGEGTDRRKQNEEEMIRRAKFYQQLMISTIF